MQTDLHACAKCVPNQFSCLESSHICECVTLLTPFQLSLEARWVNCVSLCPLPYESVYVCQIRARSVQWFGSFPRLINWLPPTTPMPIGYQAVNVELMSIPRLIYIRVPHLVPIGPTVWHLSYFFFNNPLQMPIPRLICMSVSNFVPIGPVVWKLSQIYDLMIH